MELDHEIVYYCLLGVIAGVTGRAGHFRVEYAIRLVRQDSVRPLEERRVW
jgi:hypothetical protein